MFGSRLLRAPKSVVNVAWAHLYVKVVEYGKAHQWGGRGTRH
jgi:hypothetical protein